MKNLDLFEQYTDPFKVTRETPVTSVTIRKLKGSSVPSPVTPLCGQATSIVNSWPSLTQRPAWGSYNSSIRTSTGTEKTAGVWHHSTKVNRETGEEVPHDVWICSPLHVEATTCSKNGNNFGRLLKFKDTHGSWKTWSMPMHMLSGSCETLRVQLLDMGLIINLTKRNKVQDFINAQVPTQKIIAAATTGWHGANTFVLPNQTIGKEGVIYQTNSQFIDDFERLGTLEHWNKNIGKYCSGNPLLILAVSTALAGVLLHLLEKSNGGFHFFGDSSCGKSTILFIVAAIFGKPCNFMRSWQSTANGLEGIATMRNDTTLLLDEIGEASPQEIGSVIYALSDGIGKQRANKNGLPIPVNKWRNTLLSSGETTHENLIAQTGHKAKAGLSMRLINISANRKYGVYDSLHEFDSGREFSDALKAASNNDYGIVGVQFIKNLIKLDNKRSLHTQLDKLKQEYKCDTGQEGRVAERFATSALAGELAISFGLLPWQKGEAESASLELFNSWKKHRGTGNTEDKQILQSISDFIERNGDLGFTGINTNERLNRERIGWWKMDKKDQNRIWLFTGEGLRKGCKEFDFSRSLAALNRAGWIVEKDYGKNSKTTRIRKFGTKRLYYIQTKESIEKPNTDENTSQARPQA